LGMDGRGRDHGRTSSRAPARRRAVPPGIDSDSGRKTSAEELPGGCKGIGALTEPDPDPEPEGSESLCRMLGTNLIWHWVRDRVGVGATGSATIGPMDIKTAIAVVADRRDLSEADMEAVVRDIMSGAAAPAQIGAFLVALKMKGERV